MKKQPKICLFEINANDLDKIEALRKDPNFHKFLGEEFGITFNEFLNSLETSEEVEEQQGQDNFEDEEYEIDELFEIVKDRFSFLGIDFDKLKEETKKEVKEIERMQENKEEEHLFNNLEELFSHIDKQNKKQENPSKIERQEFEKTFFDFINKIIQNQSEEDRQKDIELHSSLELNRELNLIDLRSKEKSVIEKLQLISDQYDSYLIDWNNLNQPKYYINMNYETKKLEVKNTLNRQLGVVYFKSKEGVYKAFDLLKEDLLDLV